MSSLFGIIVLHVITQTVSLEINPTVGDIKSTWANVEKWAKPERPPFSFTFSAMRPVIYKEPKGVVLIISPFNYPLWLTVSPLVRAFTHMLNL